MEQNNTTAQNGTLANQNFTDYCHEIRIPDEDLVVIADWKYWLEGVVMVLLAIPGLLATSVSIYLLARNNRNKVFSQLLTALAVYDLIYLLIMSFESLGFLFGDKDQWFYIRGLLTPYLLHPVKYISMTGSIYMMMALAVERYIAVCQPFRRIPGIIQHGRPSDGRWRRVATYIFLVTSFSILFNVTKFLESYYISKWPYFGVGLRKNGTYIIIFAVLRLIFIALIPLFVVAILNYKIYQAARKSTSRTKNDQLLLIVLTFIVLIFMLCSIPRIILVMYEVAIINTIRKCSHLNNRLFPVWWQILKFFSHILLVLNPHLNLLVYMSFGKSFRRVSQKYSTSSFLGPMRTGHTSVMSFLQRTKTKTFGNRTKTTNICNSTEDVDNIHSYENEETNEEIL